MDADKKTCPDCAETVKRAARVCKHCGCRFDVADTTCLAGNIVAPVAVRRTNPVLIAGGFIGLTLVACGAVALDMHQLGESPVDDHHELQRAAQAYITKGFLDPQSAQFQEVSANDTCVTGKVNAKNGFGAFTGFKSFYYDGRTKQGSIDPGMPSVDDLLANAKSAMKDYDDYHDSEERCMNGGKSNAEIYGNSTKPK